MPKKIGIIGANGQLGSEVSLFLSQMDGVTPVPICRNSVGASFLRRCGFDVRIGRTIDEPGSRELLKDLDLVADFSLPAGSSSYVRSQITETVTHVVGFAPSGVPFVYLSSILAFGNPDFHSDLRHYLFARSAYGSTKRFAESLVQKLCAKYHRPAYIFRVGVVHGELQAATRQALKDLKRSAHLTACVPHCESYTVFAYTVAEALVSAVRGTDRPGLYTLVSNPAWSWPDLHQYLCDKAGVQQPSELLEQGELRPPWLRRFQRSMFGGLKPYKEFLNGYIGAVFPKAEQRMRGIYHMRNAAAEIRRGEAANRYMPFLNNFSQYPGERLRGLSDSRLTMADASNRLRQTVDLLAARGAS